MLMNVGSVLFSYSFRYRAIVDNVDVLYACDPYFNHDLRLLYT